MTQRTYSQDEVLAGVAKPKPELPELPMNWEWTKLEEVVLPTIQRIPTNFFTYVDIGSIDPSGAVQDAKQLSPENAPSRARKDIKMGDTIFATTRPYLKKIAFIGEQLDGQICSTGFCVLRPDANSIDSRYLFWLARSDIVMSQVTPKMRGVSYPAVSDEDVRSTQIPLPPLLEQKRIVAKLEELLSELEHGINTCTTALQKVKRYRQSVLKAAVQGELSKTWRETHTNTEPASVLLGRVLQERRERWEAEQQAKGRKNAKYKESSAPNLEGLTELPEGWTWSLMVMVCNRVLDGTHFSPTNQFSEDGQNRFKYITAKNIKFNGIQLTNLTYLDKQTHETIFKRCNPQFEDVLLIKDGITTGVATVNQLQEEFSLLSSVALLKQDRRIILSWYLAYYLNSPDGYKRIMGDMTGTAIKRIILEKIKLTVVPLPPLEEQAFIVSEVEARLVAADHLERSINANLKRAQQLRQSILRQAFNGQLVPQDPNEEPASVLLQRIRAARANNKKTGKTSKRGAKMGGMNPDDASPPAPDQEEQEWLKVAALVMEENEEVLKRLRDA